MEQKLSETRIKENEGQYRRVFNEMVVGFALHEIILNERGLPVDYRFLEVNPAFEKLTGLKVDEVKGRTVLEVLPGLEPFWIETYGRVALTGEPVHFENLTRELNKYFEVTAFSPEKGRFAVTFTDITERKRAEEALKQSEEMFTQLAENMKELLFLQDTVTQEVLYVNSGYENIFGLPRQSLYQNPRSFLDHVSLEDRLRVTDLYEKALEGQDFRTEYRYVRPDGKKGWLLARAFPIRSEHGESNRLALLAEDITESKKAEDALRMSQAQLYQAQKMEALGTLVAGVAHEVNNPVNLITFNIPLLQRIWTDFKPILQDYAGRHPQEKFGGLPYDFLAENLEQLLADVGMAASRVANIVGSLKDFARGSDVRDKTTIQVNSAVENAFRLSHTFVRKSGVELKLDLNRDIPAIEGNLHSIEQIVMNLTINAIQAIAHDQGRVRIQTGFDKKSGRVFIAVIDNGRGIDPAVSDKIFDPFFTDKQAEGGTGLGLSVTYNLVKAHDGEIVFKSHPGQGTTFTVFLPALPDEKTKTILVVDDDDSLRQMTVQALTKKGLYSIVQAANGEEALIKLGIYRPDLLILDIAMPIMDGLEVFRVMKRQPELAGTRVIIITGFPDSPKVSELMDLGQVQVLAKPFSKQELYDIVQQTLK